jgi:predicted Rossmann fold nucleotide-binding protein DprA/Smf involved in DNA uptake
MITFHIPLRGASRGEFASFAVETGRVAFAGSRHGHVEPETCRLLVERLGSLGFSFITGCASGIDACFRSALAESEYREQALVACAFRRRAEYMRGL